MATSSKYEETLKFYKDTQNRTLMSCCMLNAYVKLVGDAESLCITGEVGNLTAENHSSSNTRYPQLIGLQESQTDSLISFDFDGDEFGSSLSLRLSLVQIVYTHQQVLELVDCINEGVIGMQSSALRVVASKMILKVMISHPVIIFPVHPTLSDHLVLSAASLTMRKHDLIVEFSLYHPIVFVNATPLALLYQFKKAVQGKLLPGECANISPIKCLVECWLIYLSIMDEPVGSRLVSLDTSAP